MSEYWKSTVSLSHSGNNLTGLASANISHSPDTGANIALRSSKTRHLNVNSTKALESIKATSNVFFEIFRTAMRKQSEKKNARNQRWKG
jgi:hypothetical protein